MYSSMVPTAIASQIQISISPTQCLLESCRFQSPFLLSNLKNRALYPSVRVQKWRNPKSRSSFIVFAQQFNFLKVIQTAWKVGNDAIDAGTSVVPAVIPRPIAKVAVAIAAVAAALFVVKSFLSTALFALAVMGLSYFIFIALNKDEGPKGDDGESGTTSVEDSLEEARRIMDKYK